MQKWILSLAAAALLWAGAGYAQAGSMEGRGRIFNADGGWCWFTQTVAKRRTAFLGNLPGRIATMQFDDPGCMAEKTKEGLSFAAEFNRKQIARRIAGLVRGAWARADVVYDPDKRYKPGIMQKSGECMASKGLPAISVAINFISDGTGISKVEYAQVYGCGDAL